MKKIQTFAEYQERAEKTAQYPDDCKWLYLPLGLCSEAGEVAGKFKKLARDTEELYGKAEISGANLMAIAYEMGDCLWYLAMLATELGLSLESIAQMNISKLSARNQKGTIKGEGDDR